jgi:hypothetical protein
MSRSRRGRVWLAAGLLLLGLGLAAFFATHHRVPVQRALPPGPEARANPLHGLTLGLRRAGQTVQLKGHIDFDADALPDRGTVILLYPEAQVETHDQAAAMMAWVEAGGRVVMPMPRGDAAPMLSDALRNDLGVEALRGAAADADCPILRLPTLADAPAASPATRRVVCGTPFALFNAIEARAVWPHAEAARLARLPYGEGEVMLLADLDLLGNDHLYPVARVGDAEADAERVRERDAATALIARLMAPLLEGDAVWVVAWRGGSLTSLLLTRGWPFLLGTGLALLAWLAWRSARVGPLVPTPPPHRRALMEHIDAAGQFAFRRDHGLGLHALMRETVIERLAQRHALARLDEPSLVLALADRCRLPRELIDRALALPPRATPEQFRDAIATLATLLHRL